MKITGGTNTQRILIGLSIKQRQQTGFFIHSKVLYTTRTINVVMVMEMVVDV